MYHQQSMWNTRQHPRIYRAFAELWNTGKLWVSIDRVCMKLPQNPIHTKYNYKGFVHWDLVHLQFLSFYNLFLGPMGTESAFWTTRRLDTCRHCRKSRWLPLRSWNAQIPCSMDQKCT